VLLSGGYHPPPPKVTLLSLLLLAGAALLNVNALKPINTMRVMFGVVLLAVLASSVLATQTE